jgi:hypothetical protein
MSATSGLLLVGAVAAVGVLHTLVPDHWVPITLIARQRGWSRGQTARVSFRAGLGHVLSTLAIALVVWLAGVAVATRFGHWVDTGASIALIGFGAWIALSAWREMHRHGGQGHSHAHTHHPHVSDASASAPGAIHGPELQRINTEHGPVELSIYEAGVPPRFRLTADFADSVVVETRREDGSRQDFQFARRGEYWQSVEEIPEPHQFAVSVVLDHEGHAHRYEARFTEHAHGPDGHHDDEHGHDHSRQNSSRTALLLILGSSPMVEGIPAFFAASKYGVSLIIVMSLVFGATTIATYMLLCVYSTIGLQRVRLGALERYGEVLSGAFIALVGLVFWIWPVL